MYFDPFFSSNKITFLALVLTPSIIVEVQNIQFKFPALKYLIIEVPICFCNDPS